MSSVVSTALIAGLNVVSLLTLNTTAPMKWSFDKATVSGTYTFYGILDSTTTTTTNAVPLGDFVVSPGQVELPQEIRDALLNWPLIMVNSPGVATLLVSGNLAPGASTIISTTAPAGTSFSALMDITALSTQGVRVMASKNMTGNDQFNVYATNDVTTNPAVTGTNGSQFISNLFGGGSPAASFVVKGWSYLFFQRDPSSTGATAGTIKAGGVVPPTTPLAPANAILDGGNTLGHGMVITELDANPTTITASAGQQMNVLSSTGAVVVNSTTGEVDIGTGAGGVDTNAKTINVGTGAAVKAVNIGSTNTTSLTNINAGTGGLNLQGTTGTGAVVVNSTTGTVNLGTGANGVDANAKTVNVGTGAGAKTVNIGSSNTTSSLQMNAGTGGVGITSGIDIVLTSAATSDIALSAGTGVSSWTIGAAGTLNLGVNGTDHTTNVGTSTGAAPLTLAGGTGTSAWTITAGGTLNVGANATDHATNLGSLTGVSPTVLQGGSGVSAWNIGSGGTFQISANATDHSTTIGSSTGNSPLLLQGGTGAGGGVSITTVTSGPLSAVSGTTGEVIVNSGTTGVVNFGTGSAGADANAKTVNVGTGAGAKTVNIGSSNTTSALALNAGTGLVTINAAVRYSAIAIANVAAGGNIGAAAATVDIGSYFNVNQTTAGQALTLPNPSTVTAGHVAYVANVGTQNFTMYGKTITVIGTPQTSRGAFFWDGAAWGGTA